MRTPPKKSAASRTISVTMYSITQMQKAENQRKSINAFFVLSPELEFDTIKAQILLLRSSSAFCGKF